MRTEEPSPVAGGGGVRRRAGPATGGGGAFVVSGESRGGRGQEGGRRSAQGPPAPAQRLVRVAGGRGGAAVRQSAECGRALLDAMWDDTGVEFRRGGHEGDCAPPQRSPVVWTFLSPKLGSRWSAGGARRGGRIGRGRWCPPSPQFPAAYSGTASGVVWRGGLFARGRLSIAESGGTLCHRRTVRDGRKRQGALPPAYGV